MSQRRRFLRRHVRGNRFQFRREICQRNAVRQPPDVRHPVGGARAIITGLSLNRDVRKQRIRIGQLHQIRRGRRVIDEQLHENLAGLHGAVSGLCGQPRLVVKQSELAQLLEVDGLQVTVLSEEPCVAYDRIKLSSVLSQRHEAGAGMADLSLKPAAWHVAHGFELRLDCKAERVDIDKRCVTTDRGEHLFFDDLILATGSQPILPPLPGIGFEGVHVFRRIADCQALLKKARPGLNAVVVGGGLLGLEAAKGLLNLGCKVSVVHLADRLMERQLDVRAAAYLQADLERQGLNFELEAQTDALLGGPSIEGLRLKEGRILPAQLLVFAIGVRPEIGLARLAGLSVNRGILVDDHMRTNSPGIWALGECAEHRGVAYGLVAPLYEQAATLAKRLAGMENAPYTGSKIYTRLKVAGLEVFSCGELSAAHGSNLIVEDGVAGIYKRAQFNGKRLRGAVLYGDSSASTRLLKALDLEDANVSVPAR